jgi:hypothetical protein
MRKATTPRTAAANSDKVVSSPFMLPIIADLTSLKPSFWQTIFIPLQLAEFLLSGFRLYFWHE